MSFDNWIAPAQGWILLQWRRDYQVESATVSPQVDNAPFHAVTVPEGTDIQVLDEFHLDYPTCVDVPPEKGVKAWGDLFGRFAVQAIPHAVAVDAKGTIVACGRLQDVLAKASGLIKNGK